MIEFSIGPNNRDTHLLVIDWLLLNKYELVDISKNGDHYSEILVKGDYLKCYDNFKGMGISFEHWATVTIPISLD